MKWKVCFVLLLVLGLSSSVWAANIYVHYAATGGNTGADWANAYTSLQSATNTAANGDTIHVASGTYKLPNRTTYYQLTSKSNISILGGYAGNLGTSRSPNPGVNLNPSLVPRNPGLWKTILDGDLNGDDDEANLMSDPNIHQNQRYTCRLDNSNWLIYLDSCTNITIDGFHLTNACQYTDGGTNNSGSAIRMNSTANGNTISNCVFYNNFNMRSGGAIGWEATGTVTIDKCIFCNNSARANGGAASFGLNNTPTTGVFTDCVFDGNVSVTDAGGAIFQWRYANGDYTDCLFINNNNPRYEGGAWAQDSWTNTNNNYSNFTRCVFLSNKAWIQGSALIWWLEEDTDVFTATLTNCLIKGNAITSVLDNNGSVYAKVENAAQLTLNLKNCTITGNLGNDCGGVNSRSGATLGATFNIKDSILWGNSGSQLGLVGDTSRPMTINMDYTCIDTTDPNTYFPPVPVGMVTVDPQFSDADCHLASTSPCVDKGDPASSYANEPARVNGCRVNMGAYGNTAEAAISTGHAALSADSDNNCVVDLSDLSNLRLQWLKSYP